MKEENKKNTKHDNDTNSRNKNGDTFEINESNANSSDKEISDRNKNGNTFEINESNAK